MPILLDGKTLAQEILADLKTKIAALELKRPPRLAAVLVGSDPASVAFLKQKEKAALECGADFRLYDFPADISNDKLRSAIVEIGRQRIVSGVIVQLPLPERLNEQAILNAIPVEKDVDVLTERNVGRFALGRLAIDPPPVGGVKRLAERHGVDLGGKHAVVVGQGRLIGRPIIWWLTKDGFTFSALNSTTVDLKRYTAEADVIITGVGKPGLITGDMVKEAVVVFDFGYAAQDGRVVGDVDFESVAAKSSYITPVPGGLGPLTVAMLFENLYLLVK